MRFVTYNIHRAVGSNGSRSIRTIASVLADLDADVIGLNEVLSVPAVANQPAQLGRWLGMEAVFRRTTLRRGVPFGNAVLVRGHVVSSSHLHLRGGREPRGALLAEVHFGGSRFTFGSTHLDLNPRVRDKQLAVLAGQLPRDRPLVFAGDFNATHERLGGLLEWLVPSPAHPTFPVPDPAAAIDYVLFSRHWRLTDSFAVPRAASDHAALVVDLELSST